MTRRKLIFLRFFLIPLTILFLIVVWFYCQYAYLSKITQPQGVVFFIQKGTETKQLAYELKQQQIINNAHTFILMSRLRKVDNQIQSGEYRFAQHATARDILNKIVSGDIERHYFIIIEGWSLQDVLNALAKDPMITHTLQNTTPRQLAHLFGIKQANPEGWFFPDTYQFIWGTTDVQILQQAYEQMNFILTEEWQQRDLHLGYHEPYQALIVASMIVKEAELDSERPIISGVILRRIHRRMRLCIDPTVIYGMGARYTGKITRKDLLTRTPYNTYIHFGLPPTPIALPGRASIQAALHPDDSQFLYFVARGDGSHQFSRTLREQDEAIRKYILDKQ